MEKVNMIHHKALLHVIKYVIDTKGYWYQIKPDGNINLPWGLCSYSDADYAGDNYTWKSVTGYIVLINGAVVSWRLQGKKTVTLSVTEAEYSSIMEEFCEIIFACDIYCLWWLLLNTPLLCMLIKLGLYSHWRTNRHPNWWST